MVSLFNSTGNASRRDFLRIGTLGLGGLTLSQLLGARAEAASTGPSLTDRSVIFVFQHGGPSQFETYDPKMTAPAEIRCQTGEIATSLPSITFGSTFPRLARLADKIAVVRGLRMGHAIGRSTRDGGDPASEPIRIRNLVATIMHYLLDINQVRVMRGIQGDVSRVITEGDPIVQLTA